MDALTDDATSRATDQPALRAASQRLQLVPFIAALGLEIQHVGKRDASMRLGGPAAASNGAIAAALDQAGSVSMWGLLGTEHPHATVSLSLSFLRPADGTPLEITTTIIGIDGGIGHTLVSAHQAATGDVVAHGMVNYLLGTYPRGGTPDQASPPAPLDPVAEAPPMAAGTDFNQWIGLKLRGGQGSFDFAPHLVGSRHPVALHGGVTAAALIGAVTDRADDGSGWRLSHIAIDYLRAGLEDATQLQTEVIHESRKACAIAANARQDGGTRHLASAAARFVRLP